MRAKWNILWIVLGLASLIFLVSFSVQRNACRKINGLNTAIDHENGNYFVSENLVKQAIAGNNSLVNDALGNIDIRKVELKLLDNPFVKEANAYKTVGGDIYLKINQEEPVARIRTHKDEYYLTETLKSIPLSNHYSPKVMMIFGKVDTSDYVQIKEFVAYINDDKLLKKHIIAVEKVKPNSFNLVVNEGDYEIEFGSLTDIDEKFNNLKLFYNQYLGKVGVNYYEKISLKYKDQIVATKRDKYEK